MLAGRQDQQRGKDGCTHCRPLDRVAAQLRGKAAAEDCLPTVKTLRLGDYANAGLLGQAAISLGQTGRVEDVGIADVGSPNVGPPRNPADGSKDNPIQILDKILNAPVSDLKVRELIGCSPSLQKLFFRSLEESDVVLEKKP